MTMRMGSYYLSREEENLVKSAICNGAYTVGFYDADGIFFRTYDASRPEEEYSCALANGWSHAVARYDGMKEVILF